MKLKTEEFTSGLQSLQREPRWLTRKVEQEDWEALWGGTTRSKVSKSPLLATWVSAHIIACLECEVWSTTTMTLFFPTIPLSSFPYMEKPSIWLKLVSYPSSIPPHLLDVDFQASFTLNCFNNDPVEPCIVGEKWWSRGRECYRV